MIGWILSLWSWFSKLSWVVKVINWLPLIKQYWTYIVIGILIVWIGILKFEIQKAENEYLKLKEEIRVITTELVYAKNSLETRQAFAAEIISKNTQAAETKIKTIKKEKDENISAIDALRSHF